MGFDSLHKKDKLPSLAESSKQISFPKRDDALTGKKEPVLMAGLGQRAARRLAELTSEERHAYKNIDRIGVTGTKIDDGHPIKVIESFTEEMQRARDKVTGRPAPTAERVGHTAGKKLSLSERDGSFE